MKLKSTTYYWLAVIFGGVGMGAAMGAEGTAQTTGYISGTLFAVSLVLILAAVLLALTIICNTEIGEMGLQIVKKDYILNYIYDKDILIQIFMSVFYQ